MSDNSRNSRDSGERTELRPVVPSDFLFRDHRSIVIDHRGEHYTLRITNNGKLILTK